MTVTVVGEFSFLPRRFFKFPRRLHLLSRPSSVLERTRWCLVASQLVQNNVSVRPLVWSCTVTDGLAKMRWRFLSRPTHSKLLHIHVKYPKLLRTTSATQQEVACIAMERQSFDNNISGCFGQKKTVNDFRVHHEHAFFRSWSVPRWSRLQIFKLWLSTEANKPFVKKWNRNMAAGSRLPLILPANAKSDRRKITEMGQMCLIYVISSASAFPFCKFWILEQLLCRTQTLHPPSGTWDKKKSAWNVCSRDGFLPGIVLGPLYLCIEKKRSANIIVTPKSFIFHESRATGDLCA